METRRVAIVGGNRIPFARSNSRYAAASNLDMLTAALDGLIARFGLTTPAYDIQQACGTGLEAAILVANKIALGQIDAGIAGGVDTTSDAPIEVNEDLRGVLLDLNRATSVTERFGVATKLRPGQVVPAIPRNEEPRTGLSMGEHQARTAAEWGVTREEQDELAAASHRNLAAAYERGFEDDLVTSYLGLERDENLRPDTTPEKLAELRPVFGGEDGTMTAGNSTPLSDGAALVLLASEDWAEERGLPVLAYLSHAETAAVDYVNGGEGLLMAPAYAMPRMLARAGLSLGDFDLYEIHEAFASQVLSTLQAWEDPVFCTQRLGLEGPLGEIDPGRLNVNGGSLAAGHPFAATGGGILGHPGEGAPAGRAWSQSSKAGSHDGPLHTDRERPRGGVVRQVRGATRARGARAAPAR